MRTFTRLAYGFILQLHPHEFRAEFGEEMLWIFDEQMRCGESGVGRVVLCAQLLLDAAHSAFIQHVLRDQQQPETLGPPIEQMSSSARLTQIAQGGFLVFSCLFLIFDIVLSLKMMMSSF
jgi:hypothetical protein